MASPEKTSTTNDFIKYWKRFEHKLASRLAVLGVVVILAGGFLVWFIPAFMGYIPVSPSFNVNLPVVGEVQLRIYTILALVAVLSAVLVFKLLQHNDEKLQKIDEWEAILFAMIPGIFAARIYYVLSLPTEQISIVEMFKLDAGGLSIVGGMLGGLLGLMIYAKVRKVDWRALLAVVTVLLPLAQGIGRFGNFFNRELLGIPTGTLWGMYVPPLFRPLGYLASDFFHPLFLYEAISNFILFGVLLKLWLKFRGAKSLPEAQQSFFFPKVYLAWYYSVRFILDFIRIDGSVRPNGLTYTQWGFLGVMAVIVFYSIWFQLNFRHKNAMWFTDHKQLSNKYVQKKHDK
jgi:phosphatidylglycerol:prolipoprotein diacylglycerol transferase